MDHIKMMKEKKESFACPKNKKKLNWLKWIFPIGGFLSLLWFLVRVVPKPSRATYPCQRMAFPLASSFVLWICGVITGAFAWRRAREMLLRNSVCKATICLVIFAVASFVAIVNMPESTAKAVIDNVPNEPMGVAKGINPGRVVWVYDPNATSWGYVPNDDKWNGTDVQGVGYWWESDNTDQNVVDDMMADAVVALADEANEVDAWDALFRNFNITRNSVDQGYQAGEKITIKVNMVAVGSNYDSSGNQTARLGWVITSPQMILALLRQLVDVAGVAQSDITVGDTLQYFPNHYWEHCHGEFPNVHYMVDVDDTVGLGREPAVSSQGDVNEARVYWSTTADDGNTPDYLPISYVEASYIINFACLKTHSAGVTLCAKNHYGSLGRHPDDGDKDGYWDLHTTLPRSLTGMGHYRPHVDLMGHSELGGKTLIHLIDGLYSGRWWQGRPHPWDMMPFKGDWPNSLFASQDPVAIDSVGLDFWLEEQPIVVNQGIWAIDYEGATEDYLHEAAEANDPCSGTFYDPDNDGNVVRLDSLGTHEHWNNSIDKRYSRNLGTGDGIELIRVWSNAFYDLDGDEFVDLVDFVKFGQGWGKEFGWKQLRDFQKFWLGTFSHRPVADAGSNQLVVDSDDNGSQSVSLDGSGSYDTDGNIVSYTWREDTNVLAYGETNSVTLDVGSHTISLEVVDDNGGSGIDTVVIQVVSPGTGPMTSSTTWQSQALSSGQSGVFTVEFDATPHQNNMDGVTGFSQSVPAGFSDLGCIARFNTSGNIDVRNGGGYSASNTVSYSAGTSYHFVMDIDIPSHQYDVYVTPQGGSQTTLASNFSFRTEQQSCTSLNYCGVYAGVGSHTIDNVTIP